MLDWIFDIFDAVPSPDLEVDSIPDDYACEDLSGVENGVFVGDEEDVEELADAGVVEDAEHIDAEDIVRSLAARNDFLASIGYSELPEGFEVHHIIPLSEGGVDDPSNMILVPEEVHQEITALHGNAYEWHKH